MSLHSSITTGHPCFNRAAQRWFKCMHLSVAPRCNIKCHYCSRLYDCPNENIAGVYSKVLTPTQAFRRVRKAVKSIQPVKVVGVCGPGDSLVNRQTFDFLNLVQREFPQLIKCVSTNGLLLPKKINELVDCGVNAISVTINAIEPQIAAIIHGCIHLAGEVYEDEDGAEILIQSQLQGLSLAVANGIAVKVNTVLIPGINDNHIDNIAVTVKRLGAAMMNIIPLVPGAEFAELRPPSTPQLDKVRRMTSPIIGQMPNCLQCVL